MDEYWEDHRLRIYVSGLICVLIVVVLWPRIMITVPAGHRGVMFRCFYGGTVLDRSWPDGFNIIPPWDHITIYETRVMDYDLEFTALTKEGLEVDVAVTARIQPIAKDLGYLHETVGPDYFKRIVAPEIQALLRSTIGDHTAESLYAAEASFLKDALDIQHNGLPVRFEKKFIHLDELLIKRITLPAVVRTAIEEKEKQQQIMHEYSFRLERETKEAERKRIEAQGIRDFQKIISEGISTGLLRWRGIEATLELARSTNAKLILIGGDGKLPVILDSLDSPRAAITAIAPEPEAHPVQIVPPPPPPPKNDLRTAAH